MTTARNRIATADELAAKVVHDRLEELDDIGIRYDRRLLAPYGVDDDDRLIFLPEGLTWRQEYTRIGRCWLYLIGGARLAPEFAPAEPGHPDRHIVSRAAVLPAPGSFPALRRVW